jgi:xanthine dehydrogenase accessory factor
VNALREAARRWLAEGRAAWVVEITRVQGSAPRAAGTRMLVGRQGIEGTIGGGHLEWLAMRTARERLAASQAPASTPVSPADRSPSGAAPPESTPAAQAEADHRHALGPSLGQCCGGVVWLRYYPLTRSVVDDWPDEPARLRVAVFGAGHVGQALVRLLATLPCQIDWIDERENPVADSTASRPTSGADGGMGTNTGGVATNTGGVATNTGAIAPLCVDSPAAELAHLPDETCVLIMTHSHAQDFEICEAALRAGRFRQVGVIGSQTKAARFRRQLHERGLDESVVTRLVCPIGVPGIQGREPAVIAVAVAAQLLGA